MAARDPEEAATAVLAPFSSIHEEQLDELAEAAAGERLGGAIAYLELDGTDLRHLHSPVNAGWVHFGKLISRAASGMRLPRLRFLLNLGEEARCVPSADRSELWWHPSPDDYVSLVERTAASEAARHPSIFAPGPRWLTSRNVPIFSIAGVSGLHADVLYPGPHATYPMQGSNLDDIRWEEKEAALYWRGSCTGGSLTLENMWRFPRTRLVAHRDLDRHLDLGITRVVQTPNRSETERIVEALQGRGLFVEREPQRREFDYRFLFDIDGNISAFRLPRLLRSNGAVFRGRVNYREYYYRWLVSGEHYVELADFDELAATVAWARERDDELRRIAGASQGLAETLFSWDFALAYMRHLLSAYAERFVPSSRSVMG